METVKNACICCGGTEVPDHLAGLCRCPTCGHVWADLHLTPEELGALYSERYFKGEEYMDYQRQAPALRRNFRARVRELARRYPKGSSLFEIGSAYGYFLKEAAEHFTVAGCEQYDVICLWDTVEHLQSPHLYLEKAVGELRPEGTLALSTGDIGSLCARLRGPKWRLIHPPTHLHYFTVNSMTTLLRRLGLYNIEVRHLPFWRSADAVANKILCRPGAKWGQRIYGSLKRTGSLSFCCPMNLFDLMTVYAVKKPGSEPI